MHQPDYKQDIIIPVGKMDQYDTAEGIVYKSSSYNVSEFLRLHDSDEHSRSRIVNADKFIHLLDAKVYIDTSDPKYAKIYHGIDTIVKRVIAGLSKLDPFFAECKLRQTGSSMSGVKVGLPHESDYVLETPRDSLLQTGKSFEYGTLFPLVCQIITEQSVAFTDGLEGSWMIHGVEKHELTGGVALVMQCLSSKNDSTIEEVGVTVDLVPVHIMETTTMLFTAKAEAFLHHSLAQYAEKGELYGLFFGEKCDTGFIENTIMKQLPEDTKQAFRVAKFLTSHFLISPFIRFDLIQTLDKNTLLRLYGHKPWISSYKLRVFFFRLLIHVHGTEAEHRIKGGLLVLCLLDMLKQSEEKYQKAPTACTIGWLQTHPLLKDTYETSHFHIPLKPLKMITRLMEEENPADAVQQMCLLNTKYPVYDDSDSESETND